MRSHLPFHRLKIPLRLFLVVPFVLLLVITVGVTNYFSIQNSRESVQELAHQLMEEVSDRVHLYLDNYLEQIHQINRSNASTVRFAQLDPRDMDAVERRLIWQFSNLANIDNILYANEQGSFRVTANIDGVKSIFVTDSPNIKKFAQYAISPDGKRSQLLKMGEYPPNWDIRQRSWYKLAKQKKQATWSSIYTLGDGSDLTINASLPVYDSNTKEFIGAFSVNLHLSRLNQFFKKMKLGNSGIFFLMEPNSYLISSSINELPFIKTKDGKFKRILATESQHPLIRDASRYLASRIKQGSKIEELKKIEFIAHNRIYCLQVQPYQDSYGLNWLLATVIPKTEFMAEIDAHTYNTIQLTLVSAIVAILLGILIANGIARPILLLSQTSAAMAQGNLNLRIPEHLPVRELDRMARSFNGMAQQLQAAFDRINTNLRESESRYATIFRNSPDPISITTLEDGRWIDVNNSFLQASGYTCEEIIGRTALEINFPVNPQQLETIFQELKQTGIVKNQEFPWRTKSGEVKISLISCETIEIAGETYIINISKEIGELKKVEEALRQSEERFLEIGKTISQMFFMRSAITGKFIYVSPAYQQIWGRSGESLYENPQSWVETIHPNDRTLVEESIRIQFEGNSVSREYRIIRPNGEIRWVFAQINLVRDEMGNPSNFIGFATDITDRKHLELALQNSEAKLSDIINSPIASIIRIQMFADRNWNIDYLSAGCETIFGYTRKEFFDDKSIWMARIVPEDVENVILPLFEEIFLEKTLSYEYRFYHKDGSLRWLSARITSRYDTEANCWWLNQFTVDITDRKQAEIALSESEQRLRLILESSPLAIFIKDLQGRYTRINPAYEQMTQLSKDQLLGITDWELLPAEKAVMCEESDRVTITQKQPITFEEQVPFVGGVRHLLVTKFPLCDTAGTVYAVCGIVIDLTERKRAEEALQESEARLRSLADNLPGAIYTYTYCGDGTSVMEYISEGCAEILGICAQEVMADFTVIEQCIYQEDLPSYYVAVESSFKNLTPLYYEYRHLRPDGNICWLAVSARHEIRPDGSIAWRGVLLDISDRKQAEEALQQKTQELEHFFSSAIDLLCIANTDGYFIRLNPEWEKALGYSVLELEGKRFLDFVHPEDLELTLSAIGKLSDQEPIFTFTNRYCHRDGSYRWLEWRSIPTGQYIYATARDITDRKLTEAKLQVTLNRLQNLATAVPGNIYSLVQHPDGSLEFEYTNEKLAEIAEISIEEVLKDPASIIIDQIHPDDRQGYLAAVNRSQESLTIFKHQWRIITPSGKPKWLEGHSQPERRDKGDIVWHGIVIDISDRKQTEAELQKAKEIAEAANQAKSEFLANMSHEIRTPMNAILGFCDLLQNCITEPQPRFYLQSIAASGKTLLSLINDILDLSKIEAGKLQLHYEPVNLRVLTQEICHIFSQKAQEKHLSLESKINENVPTGILFDEVRLRQILFNVVGNALKFTERGTVKISANCHFPPTPELNKIPQNQASLEIAVIDTGIGIPSEQQSSIFDAFLQVEGQSNRQYGGTGLGLAIVKRLTNLLGGTVTLQSQVNEGSTFTFTFPAVAITDPLSAQTTKCDLDGNLDRFKAVKILAVDDVPSNLKLLQSYFAGTKHEILLAKDGLEAVNIARHHNPDVILLDWRMPNMDGLEASKVLQEDDRTKNIPIIMITASALKEELEILRSTCQGFLSKPISRQQLVSELKRFLNLDPSYLEFNSDSLIIQPKPALSALSPETLEKLPQLLETLYQEEKTVWPNLCNSMIRRDLKKFAERLQASGEQYNYLPLLKYAKTLEKQIQEFDFERLPETIKSFPKIRAELDKFNTSS